MFYCRMIHTTVKDLVACCGLYMSIWHCPFRLFWFLILLYITFPFSLPFPTFIPSHFPHPPAHLLSGAVLCVRRCIIVYWFTAGVLLYTDFFIHVNEMVKLTKESMFITVLINIWSSVPGKKGDEWLQLWMNNISLESWIFCSCEQ